MIESNYFNFRVRWLHRTRRVTFSPKNCINYLLQARHCNLLIKPFTNILRLTNCTDFFTGLIFGHSSSTYRYVIVYPIRYTCKQCTVYYTGFLWSKTVLSCSCYFFAFLISSISKTAMLIWNYSILSRVFETYDSDHQYFQSDVFCTEISIFAIIYTSLVIILFDFKLYFQ